LNVFHTRETVWYPYCRARFIRAFLFPAPGEEAGKLQKLAKKVFLAPKPPPTIESKFKNRYG
jgi:AP-3 complex subunit beta